MFASNVYYAGYAVLRHNSHAGPYAVIISFVYGEIVTRTVHTVVYDRSHYKFKSVCMQAFGYDGIKRYYCLKIAYLILKVEHFVFESGIAQL